MPALPIAILDSVTHIKAEHRGSVAYCASHGGVYAGAYAARCGISAVILNDAGIGREQAGVGGLALLETLGVPAAAISHLSARIGDGADGAARGRLSVVNNCAQKYGLTVGMRCADALETLSRAALAPAPLPPTLSEARFEIPGPWSPRIRVIGIDSNALVTEADIGQIVVTGSHGGLLGGKPETAIKVAVRAAVYNDAGGGVDNAGLSRLPALDGRGIAGACVSAFSARIGDARSTFEDGFISAVNQTAAARGGAIGQSTRTFVLAMAS
jgi:hypothetical protein